MGEILAQRHNSVSYKIILEWTITVSLTDLQQSSFHQFAVSPSQLRHYCWLQPESGTCIVQHKSDWG